MSSPRLPDFRRELGYGTEKRELRAKWKRMKEVLRSCHFHGIGQLATTERREREREREKNKRTVSAV